MIKLCKKESKQREGKKNYNNENLSGNLNEKDTNKTLFMKYTSMVIFNFSLCLLAAIDNKIEEEKFIWRIILQCHLIRLRFTIICPSLTCRLKRMFQSPLWFLIQFFRMKKQTNAGKCFVLKRAFGCSLPLIILQPSPPHWYIDIYI